MPSCAIRWCGKSSKTSSNKKDGITFHRFPNDPVKKEKWIDATQKDDFFPTKNSVICSRHFTPDCLENLKGDRRRLYISAVPTLHLPLLIPTADSENIQDQPSSSKDITNQLLLFEETSLDGNDGDKEQYLDLTPRERKMQRHIDNLVVSLNKKKKDVKRLQDKTRKLKNKIASLQETLDNLTS